MEIYPNGKTKNINQMIKKLAQMLNTNEKIEFPFDYLPTSDEKEFYYPADRIGGFAQIKHKLNIPQEIYVRVNDVRNIGSFVLNLLTKSEI